MGCLWYTCVLCAVLLYVRHGLNALCILYGFIVRVVCAVSLCVLYALHALQVLYVMCVLFCTRYLLCVLIVRVFSLLSASVT